MSTVTAESLLPLIAQMPKPERVKLRVLLDEQVNNEQHPNGQLAKPPRDKRLPSKPMRDCSREMQWIADHSRQYVRQWVALDGDRLIAASPNHDDVAAAVDADGAILPLFHFFDDPDKIYVGF
jgi:hypothetical protein